MASKKPSALPSVKATPAISAKSDISVTSAASGSDTNANAVAIPVLSTSAGTNSRGNSTVIGSTSGTAIGNTKSTETLPEHASNELLVHFQGGTSATGRAKALAAVGGTALEAIWSDNQDSNSAKLLRVKFDGSLPTAKAISVLSQQPGVKFAEPNFIVTTQATSNDPYFTSGSQWDMRGDGSTVYGARADSAWNSGLTGSTKTVVGVVDSGVDYRHPDLYLNTWLNQGEIPAALRSALADTDGDALITFRDLNNVINKVSVSDLNGNGYIDGGDLLKDVRWADNVDSDGNGYRDDLIGWNFANNNNDPLDDNNHGTHVSGTIGGIGGNSKGIVGVNWSTQIMPLKFITATGSGSTSDAIRALDYFTLMSKSVSTASDFVGTNNSWGGGGFSQSMQDAIVRSAAGGNVFVAAAGNGGSDGVGDNNDVVANYPANYSTQSTLGWDSILSVAALTSSGTLSSFSNFGNATVDLAAPGSGIWSTVINGGYASYSGTSMAAPHVMGALALIASAMPQATPQQLLNTLRQCITTKSDLASTLAWDGWLDLGKLSAVLGVVAPAPAPPPASQTLYGTDGNDTLTGGAGNDTISGVPASTTKFGRASIDVLGGGAGNDLFVLGASGKVFYDDANSRSAGTADYARINDFVSGQDRLQLAAGKSYAFNRTTLSGTSGINLYWDSNANGKLDVKSDELIAFIAGVSSITGSDVMMS